MFLRSINVVAAGLNFLKKKAVKNNNYNYFRQTLQDRTLEYRQLTWFVTNRCDLACEHCGFSANERRGFLMFLRIWMNFLNIVNFFRTLF